MFTAYIVVTCLATAANLYAASNDFRRVPFVLENMERLNMPRSLLSTFGILKTAGAVGLLVGIAIPVVGGLAATGLVVFFLGAIFCTLRVRWYSHLPFPVTWLALAVGALALRLKIP